MSSMNTLKEELNRMAIHQFETPEFEAQRAVLNAAHDCMEIDRAYRGALADAMLNLD